MQEHQPKSQGLCYSNVFCSYSILLLRAKTYQVEKLVWITGEDATRVKNQTVESLAMQRFVLKVG